MVIGVVILIFIISIFFSKTDFLKSDQQKKILGQQQELILQTPSPTPTPTSTPKPTGNPTPTLSNNSQVIIKQEVKDNSKANQNFNSSDFKYPQSNQISSSGNNLILESNDSYDLITNWYKEKIRSLGFKSKSFVQTKTNGNILNKLVGASGSTEVMVEIKKSAEISIVSITVILL